MKYRLHIFRFFILTKTLYSIKIVFSDIVHIGHWKTKRHKNKLSCCDGAHVDGAATSMILSQIPWSTLHTSHTLIGISIRQISL